jgi:hypothetical protein
VLVAEYDQQHPTSQMMILDSLLDLKSTGTALAYTSVFNVIVAKLHSV